MEWIKTKDAKPEHDYTAVLLHTPQWEETLGSFVSGQWSEGAFQADDERDLTESQPVHWALVNLPAFRGDPEDWFFLRKQEIEEAIENCKDNGHWDEKISDADLAAELIEHGWFEDEPKLDVLTAQITRVRADSK